ncbi:hypothetical protein AA12717_2951 [Gluconacetobacter sacchari DSM 12717]|uniref:LysR family transcriptional regulator n=1 Tax=Gluconacetobacter sacchari DSM 12717 TaxID=1307940 RepID=A0ABQ0PAD2_9PROT|nr:hypothetical protein AA12717_2951 [Gluconacetobacter sacchari DSM 12717]
MQDYELASVPLNLLIIPERAKTARVRLVVDFLISEIRKLPGIVIS